jgi:hypothetical protein
VIGSRLCEQLVDERLQLGVCGHDPRGLHQLGSLAEQPSRGPMPAGETGRAVEGAEYHKAMCQSASGSI